MENVDLIFIAVEIGLVKKFKTWEVLPPCQGPLRKCQKIPCGVFRTPYKIDLAMGLINGGMGWAVQSAGLLPFHC
jgi:hypothetical protein